jgi:hypothetical protein
MAERELCQPFVKKITSFYRYILLASHDGDVPAGRTHANTLFPLAPPSLLEATLGRLPAGTPEPIDATPTMEHFGFGDLTPIDTAKLSD